jgi:hypothetical protein
VRRSTSGDILDQFEGDLKFCTDWLYLDGSHGSLYRRRDRDGLNGWVGCTDLIREKFLIPSKVSRIAFVFTTEPNGGDLRTRVYESSFRDFTRRACDEAGIQRGLQGLCSWYWHVILDWKD